MALFVLALPLRHLERFTSMHAPPLMDVTGASVQLVSKIPKVLRIASRLDVNGVPVEKGVWIDVVTRTSDTRVEGRYFVLDAIADTVLISEARIMTLGEVRGALYERNNVVVGNQQLLSPKLERGDTVYFTDRDVFASVRVLDATDMSVVLRITKYVDAKQDHAFNNASGLCFDADGLPHNLDGVHIERACKDVGGTWDKPCAFDFECPFFGANKTLQTLRGGCNSGYCELPMGVARTGFKTYDRSSTPACHGCEWLEDGKACCDRTGEYKYDATGVMRAFVQYATVMDPPQPPVFL